MPYELLFLSNNEFIKQMKLTLNKKNILNYEIDDNWKNLLKEIKLGAVLNTNNEIELYFDILFDKEFDKFNKESIFRPNSEFLISVMSFFHHHKDKYYVLVSKGFIVIIDSKLNIIKNLLSIKDSEKIIEMNKSCTHYVAGKINLLEGKNIFLLELNYEILLGKRLYPNHVNEETFKFDVASLLRNIISEYGYKQKMLNCNNCNKLFDTLFICEL